MSYSDLLGGTSRKMYFTGGYRSPSPLVIRTSCDGGDPSPLAPLSLLQRGANPVPLTLSILRLVSHLRQWHKNK